MLRARVRGIVALLAALGSASALTAQAPQTREIRMGADTRRTQVVVPGNVRAGARGLVVLLHGHGGTGAALLGFGRGRAAPYRRWLPIAERERLVLLAPDGLVGPDRKSGWNDCRADAATNPTGDDVAFLVRLINDARQQYGIPADRVFVMGTSNGAQIALRLAIERPASVRAVASIVGAMPARSECASPTVPVSVLFMNGTADPLVPYGGGAVGGGRDARGSVLGVDSSVAVWRSRSQLVRASDSAVVRATQRGDATIAERTAWSREKSATLVVRYRIVGGGHVEPSQRERHARFTARLLGTQSSALETVDEVWRFFQQASGQPARE
jgi:polyhydroxybutyrate depolymerase